MSTHRVMILLSLSILMMMMINNCSGSLLLPNQSHCNNGTYCTMVGYQSFVEDADDGDQHLQVGTEEYRRILGEGPRSITYPAIDPSQPLSNSPGAKICTYHPHACKRGEPRK